MTDQEFQSKQLTLLAEINKSLGCLSTIAVISVLAIGGMIVLTGCTIFLGV